VKVIMPLAHLPSAANLAESDGQFGAREVIEHLVKALAQVSGDARLEVNFLFCKKDISPLSLDAAKWSPDS
jgi:hypothetical protein